VKVISIFWNAISILSSSCLLRPFEPVLPFPVECRTGGTMATTVAFRSTTVQSPVYISTNGKMDPAFMADRICGDRSPMRWKTCKERLVRKRYSGAGIDPSKHHFAGVMLSIT
jgi:hypothetical protein